MSNASKKDILLEVERLRGDLIALINQNADMLREQVLKGTDEPTAIQPYEQIYPLATTPSIFKGKKPIAVHFAEDEVEVKTWKEAYVAILQRCDAEKHEELMGLRGKISGKKRAILAATAEGMSRAVEISEGLYAESFFDSESQMRVLTELLLTPAGFDYSGIRISVRTGRGCANE
jgi:hypothetical protein